MNDENMQSLWQSVDGLSKAIDKNLESLKALSEDNVRLREMLSDICHMQIEKAHDKEATHSELKALCLRAQKMCDPY